MKNKKFPFNQEEPNKLFVKDPFKENARNSRVKFQLGRMQRRRGRN
jgi:hypothetical protein